MRGTVKHLSLLTAVIPLAEEEILRRLRLNLQVDYKIHRIHAVLVTCEKRKVLYKISRNDYMYADEIKKSRTYTRDKLTTLSRFRLLIRSNEERKKNNLLLEICDDDKLRGNYGKI